MKSRKLLKGFNIDISDDILLEVTVKQGQLFPVDSYFMSKDKKIRAAVVNGVAPPRAPTNGQPVSAHFVVLNDKTCTLHFTFCHTQKATIYANIHGTCRP